MSYVELSEVADVVRGVLRTTKSESVYRLRPSDVASGKAPERGELAMRDQVTAQTGDIAINLAYQPGAAMLITDEMRGVAPTDGIALVRPKYHARLHRDFLTQWLLAGDAVRQLKRSVLGSHMIYVKVSAVQKIQVPVPPLEEQLQLIDGCKSADEWRRLAQSMFDDASKLFDLERRRLNALLRNRMWPAPTQGETS
jgi:restriction endonuclease S subunit